MIALVALVVTVWAILSLRESPEKRRNRDAARGEAMHRRLLELTELLGSVREAQVRLGTELSVAMARRKRTFTGYLLIMFLVAGGMTAIGWMTVAYWPAWGHAEQRLATDVGCRGATGVSQGLTQPRSARGGAEMPVEAAG